MSSFPINADNWALGASLENYVNSMETFQEVMQRRLLEVQLLPDEIARFSRLKTPVKISVLSEDWCIDCVMTLPIVARLAAVAPVIELKLFSRSKWPVLKEYYNSRGIMSIPVYSFLTSEFVEFGTFVERPLLAAQKMTEWKAAHPEVDQIRRSFSMSSEEKSTRLAAIRAQMQTEMEGWYRDGCQSALLDEFAAILGI